MFPMETDRLILREFTQEDFTDVHDYARDPEVVRFMLWGPNTESETRSFLSGVIAEQSKQPRAEYEMAIVLKATDRVIGSCSLHISSTAHHEASLGYCLHRQYWGQGYMTEAAHQLLHLGFEKLHLHRIFATCDPHNIGSARVMEKIGMQREGCLRQHRLIHGEWRDSLVYAILEQEFRK